MHVAVGVVAFGRAQKTVAVAVEDDGVGAAAVLVDSVLRYVERARVDRRVLVVAPVPPK
jgi:hypothetical protein